MTANRFHHFVKFLCLILLLNTGCVSAHRLDLSKKELNFKAISAGDSLMVPRFQMTPTNGGWAYSISYDRIQITNSPSREFQAFTLQWSDRSKGGGIAAFSDPKASAISHVIKHQPDVGGEVTFKLGEFSAVISTNAISSTGTAVGNVAEKIIQGIK